MYKLVVLAVLVAAASASVINAGYGLPLAAGIGYAGAPLVSAGYGHAIAQPVVHARTYAAPPVREYQEAPIVQQYVEPVEKHGYKIRY